MFNKLIFKIENKIKIIILTLLIIISIAGLDLFLFINNSDMDLIAFILGVLDEPIFLLFALPFLSLLYFFKYNKELNFNKQVIIRTNSRTMWFQYNLIFIFKNILIFVLTYILCLIVVSILNFNNYKSFSLNLNELVTLIKYILFLIIYLFNINIIYLIIYLLVNNHNITLVLSIIPLIIDSTLVELYPRTMYRFFFFANVLPRFDQINGLFSIFYWILTTALLLLSLDTLKNKKDFL